MHRSVSRALIRSVAAVGFLSLAACAAPSGGSASSRLLAIHNAYRAVGLTQMGNVTQSSLGEGAAATFTQTLDPGCYTFVATAGDGARGVQITVRDTHNQAAQPVTSPQNPPGTEAVLQFCPLARGEYSISIKMVQGSGSYAFSYWQGGAHGAGSAAVGGDSDVGTCASPIPIQLGQTIQGDTSHAHSNATGTCVSESEAPELVYVLTLDQRKQVTVAAEQDYDGVLYIRQNCEDQGSEVPGACNDDDPDTSHSRVIAALDPGTYYIFADGYSESSGSFSLTVTGADVPTPAEVCQNAQPLTPGQAISGQTAADPNVFQATCADSARGPDHVFRLDVAQESRVQLFQETDYDGAVYVRRACADAASEVACNDNAEDMQHSRINTVLPPGTYYVFTDGSSPSASGNFTLEADLSPVAGSGVPGDNCQDAQPLTPGTPVDGNTFTARDDVASPCATSTDGYDVVYRVDIAARTRLKLWFESSDLEQAAIWITRNCTAGAPHADVACRVGNVGEDSAVDAVLEPGQYFVVVDSATPRAFGRFRLMSRAEDLTALERVCRTAPMLRNHQTVHGTTTGDDRFQASCASGAHSPENLYRLVLRQRSFVRLNLESTRDNYDPAIYIRANCTDIGTERDCNDDAGDVRHSLIETTLDAGTYTVFVDGYGDHNEGTYTLQATIQPQAGGAAPTHGANGAGAGGGGGALPRHPRGHHP